MSAWPKFYLDIHEAARIAYPPGWRRPLTDEIDGQRAIESREFQRRDDKYLEDADLLEQLEEKT